MEIKINRKKYPIINIIEQPKGGIVVTLKYDVDVLKNIKILKNRLLEERSQKQKIGRRYEYQMLSLQILGISQVQEIMGIK